MKTAVRKSARTRAPVTLKIPRELFDKLTVMIQGTGFRSVTEFAIYVLRDLAAGGKLDAASSGLSDREIEVVRDRLKTLGYIE